MNTFIQKMPKAELHLHLEGAVRPDTAALLYNERHDPIDSFQIKTLYNYDNLKSFIDGMQRISDNIRTPEHLHQITRELLETCALQNIIYLEFDCALQKYIDLGLPLRHVVDAITTSMKEAEALYGIKSRLLANVQRTQGINSALEMVKELLSLQEPLVVGIGMSGYEKNGDIAGFAPVFQLAKTAGLHLTAHAGEVTGSESVWNALELLHVERIDHGTRAIEDNGLLEYLHEHKIPLTQCLSSNVRLGVCNDYETHPFSQFYRSGILVTLNTDDPEVFQVSLTGEYQKAANYYGLNNADMINIVNNTIHASFLNAEEKKELLEQVQKQNRTLLATIHASEPTMMQS